MRGFGLILLAMVAGCADVPQIANQTVYPERMDSTHARVPDDSFTTVKHEGVRYVVYRYGQGVTMVVHPEDAARLSK